MKSEHSSGKQASRLQALVGQTMIAVLKGALGVLLGCLIVYGIALRVSTPHSSSAPQATTYIWNGEAKPDDASWRLALRDMTEAESLRIETRLRDHFTLLLALAGISTALILGLFSLLQSRREEKALEELRELKREAVTLCREAEEKLKEIRACADQSYNLGIGLGKLARSKLQGDLSSFGPDGFNTSNPGAGEYAKKAPAVKNKTPDSVLPEPPSSDADIASLSEPATEAAELGSSVAAPDTTQAAIPAEPDAQEEDVTKPSDFATSFAAAERGDADAQCDLGTMYANGMGVEKDEAKALHWFSKAAGQGYARAQFNLGVMHAKGSGGMEKDEVEAARLFRKAARQGLAQAQFNLGFMYAGGRGVEKDETEAEHWYRKAAEQGNASAQCSLGVMYEYGIGVEKNETEAARWFRKAAEQGEALAQWSLGGMYEDAKGVEKDDAKAEHWYRKAAEQGCAPAQFNLGAMYTNGWGVGKNEAEASRWFLAAARQGFLQAVLQMAWRYHSGIGVTEDFEEAYVFLLLYKALANSEDNGEVQSLQKSLRELLSKAQIAGAQRKASELFNDIRDKA